MLAPRRRGCLAAAARAWRVMPAWLALAGTGCVFDDLDFTGKSCSVDAPCPAGWVCSDQQCAATDSPCKFQPSNVRIAWTTPQSIRWEWDAPEDVSSFGTYRLRTGVGPGPEAGGEVRVVTAAENPELGRARIPRIDGDLPVQSTITREHVANELYWGQLEAIDNEGCTWASPVLGATTALQPPIDQVAVAIFQDELVPGSWLYPTDAGVVPGAGSYLGDAHIAWDVDKTDGENLQFGALGLALDTVGSNGSALQTSAYLELAVSFEAESPSFYTRVVMQLPPEGEGPHSRLEGFTLPADGQYHLVQIPIRALAPDDGHPMAATDMLQKFMFGCTPFEADTHLRVDEVYIRW